MAFKAFIIGVPQYDDNGIGDLPFVKTDIENVYSTFLDHLKIKKSDIKVLGRNETEITWKNILKELKIFLRHISEDDTVLIYYSGHGASIESKGYLICFDTEVDLLKRTSLAIEELKDLLVTSEAKNNLLFLDSCHSGADIGKSIGSKFVVEEMQKLNTEGWSILSSCKSNELSYATIDGTESVFTKYLCEAFSGSALETGASSLSLSRINDYIHKNVTRYVIAELSASQTPTLISERAGEFFFEISEIEVEGEADSKNDPTSMNWGRIDSVILSHKYFSKKFESVFTVNEFRAKDVEYTDQERKDNNLSLSDKNLISISTRLLDFFKPSELTKKDYYGFQYPLGEYKLSKEAYSHEIDFYINSRISAKALSILRSFGDQKVIRWNSISFITKNTIQFDEIQMISKKNNYTIKDFDLTDKSMTIGLVAENDIELNLKIEQVENSTIFKFSESSRLRENFFEILPFQDIMGRFIKT